MFRLVCIHMNVFVEVDIVSMDQANSRYWQSGNMQSVSGANYSSVNAAFHWDKRLNQGL